MFFAGPGPCCLNTHARRVETARETRAPAIGGRSHRTTRVYAATGDANKNTTAPKATSRITTPSSPFFLSRLPLLFTHTTNENVPRTLMKQIILMTTRASRGARVGVGDTAHARARRDARRRDDDDDDGARRDRARARRVVVRRARGDGDGDGDGDATRDARRARARWTTRARTRSRARSTRRSKRSRRERRGRSRR